MKNLAYKIVKLKELEALRRENDSETFQKAIGETSPPEPSPTIPEPEKSPLDAGEMPQSVEGIRMMELRLLYNDGQMTENEKSWFEKRTIPDAFPPGAYEWMKH